MSDGLKILRHKITSLWSEFYLGINTRGLVQPPTSEGVHYTPLPYPMIFKMRKVLDMKAGDVFYDIGCGKGRVVCCMCQLPIKKVVAIELNQNLLQQTINNVSKLRGRKCPVEAHLQSAEECDYDNATVIYLYNPFNARLTELVFERLFQSWSRCPRTVRVVYANPVHEHALRAHHWLEKYAEWPATAFPVFGYAVSFWSSDHPGARPPASQAAPPNSLTS